MLTTRRAVIVSCLLFSSRLGAEQGIFGGGPKYRRFNAAGVSFEHPDDWQQMTVPPPVVALFTKGQETSFTVNRSPVDFPQVFNQEFAAYEAKLVPQAYPGASAISSKPIVHARLGQLLRIDFMKPGTAQARDRRARQLQLRLFSIPSEAFVYRITCVAPAEEFAKRYEPIFTHMIESLVITTRQSHDYAGVQ
jgi:hypothetical protein